MDVNSKEFEKKHKEMIEKGYCRKCIAILTSTQTLSKICKKCEKIFKDEWKI